MPHIAIPAGDEPVHSRAFRLRPELEAPWVELLRTVQEHSILSFREQEASRFQTALANGCLICQAARPSRDGECLPESYYAAIADEVEGDELTERERLAADFARRFGIDHHSIDAEYFEELRRLFSDAEIFDLAYCTARNTGFGRMTHVLGLDDTCSLTTSAL